LDFIKRFCQTWIDHLPNNTDLVIADNASTDESLQYLKINFPQVGIIALTKNHGFAQGYNLAMEQVDTPYCILLNSDIEIKSYWIEPLIELLEQDTRIAAVQPKILDQKSPEHFEYAGAAGGLVDKLYYPFCRGRIFQSIEKDQSQYNDPTEIFWASGAAIALRTQAFKDLDGFDADFFAHMEEIDLCWRFKLMGKKIYYQPKSAVYHVGGGTLAYASSRKTFLNFRNSLLMIFKNEEPGRVFHILFRRMILDGIAALSFLLKGQVGAFFAVFKAHLAFYGLLGKFRSKKKLMQGTQANSTPNMTGRISKSVLTHYYLKGQRKYSDFN
jgi:GT2 family glycosyltransferase